MTGDSKIRFRNEVKSRLQAANLTQEKFAQNVGIGKTTLNYIINGERNLTDIYIYAEKISKGLGLEGDYFKKYVSYDKKMSKKEKESLELQDYFRSALPNIGVGNFAVPIGEEFIVFNTKEDLRTVWSIVESRKRSLKEQNGYDEPSI